uniref:Antistasin/WAP-like serine protease inhibitor n=1 Tax=Stichopus monotuberculatus TaxID=576894 RepID=A0A1D9CF31_STIMO|nr:antistasin/WAP-like serine protease inhibitor [Stichopus monotuberculatus]AOY33896.1 antistasin/WAP-like serine protease inhibitor [Stichopus monotuberculatus]
MCAMFCEHGFEQDDNGCDTCFCKPAPCPPVMCNMYCPYGFQKNDQGCDICFCNEKPDVCADFMCMMHCPNGFQRDENGCEICQCTEVPQIHPGTCPALADDAVGSCVNLCDNDADCSSSHKCCSNGCGYTCAPAENVPVECPTMMCFMWCPYGYKKDNNGCDTCTCNEPTVIHEGHCPVPPPGSMGICAEMCQHDGDCTTNQKCCSNGCGHVCIDALHGVKPGECPAVDSTQMGICVEECSSDTNCTGHQKCCSNGCGHVCRDPADKPVVRPGTCPVNDKLQEGMLGACVNMCDNDSACSVGQKCCSNGCGRVCMTVVDEPVGCDSMTCMMFCEYGNKIDVHGCKMCVCNDPPSVHDGTCPVVSSDTVGICVEMCSNDDDCSETQKCCSNGCGHVCVAAENVPVKHPGSCPVNFLPEGSFGICSEMCSGDEDCASDEKCCSNGCGHACLAAVDVPPVCPDVMCAMFCEHGFQVDDDGCEICVCKTPPGEIGYAGRDAGTLGMKKWQAICLDQALAV